MHFAPSLEKDALFVNASPPQKPRTDWFIWSLHLILGLLLGLGLGFVVGGVMLRPWGSTRLFRLDLIAYDQLGIVVLGVSLIVGAITSFKGNRLWYKPSLWDAEQPPRSRLSGAVSITLGLAGLLVIAWAVCQHLAVLPPPNHSLLKSPALLALLLTIGFMIFLVVHALREGRFFLARMSVDREEAPLVFWLIMVCVTISLIAVLLWLFR